MAFILQSLSEVFYIGIGWIIGTRAVVFIIKSLTIGLLAKFMCSLILRTSFLS